MEIRGAVKRETEKAVLVNATLETIGVDVWRAHGTDDTRVDAIIAAMEHGTAMPPILVVDGDGYDCQYRCLDGHHRLAACKRLGIQTIDAYVVQAKDVSALLAEVEAWGGDYPANLNDLDDFIFLPSGKRYERI